MTTIAKTNIHWTGEGATVRHVGATRWIELGDESPTGSDSITGSSVTVFINSPEQCRSLIDAAQRMLETFEVEGEQA